MIGTAPDQRLGSQAFHFSPGGDWWALSVDFLRTARLLAVLVFAFIRTNTGPGSREKPLYSDYWMAITKSSEMCMTIASQNVTASGVLSQMRL